jgi:hypothetical protein
VNVFDIARLVIAAGETTTQDFDITAVGVNHLQPKGLVAAIGYVELPTNWTPCKLSFGVSDWRGEISVDTQPGQVISGPPEIWKHVSIVRFSTDRAQAETVALAIGMTAVESDQPRMARPVEMQQVAPNYFDRFIRR